MQRLVQSSLVLLLLTAAGCVAYEPRPLLPAEALASLRERDLARVDIERVNVGGGGYAPSYRFDLSDGLDEGEVVSVALTLNPSLQARRAEIGEARALLITAGLWPNPEVGVAPKWGIDGASGLNVEADALFHLLRPGELSARKSVARARVAEVEAEIVAAEFETVAETRAQWLQVLVAEQTVQFLNEEVALRERAVSLTSQRRRVGDATELDTSAAQLELAEVRRDLRQAQTDAEVARRELNGLLGLPGDYVLRLSDSSRPLAIAIFSDLSDEELDRRVLAGRPELRARQQAYERSEQELRLAVLGQYPRLGVGPAFERELEGDKAIGLGLSLELPAFNRNQGEIAAARAARERARAEYIATLHRLRTSAIVARASLQRARVEVDMQEKEVLPLIRRNQELVEGALQRRDISILDWITAQQRAVRARREYLETLARYRTSVAQLEAATGTFLARPTTQPVTAPGTPPPATGADRTSVQSPTN